MNHMFELTLPALPAGRSGRAQLLPLDGTSIDPPYIHDSRELLDLQWLDIGGISCLNMPGVERSIVEDMIDPMKADPSPGFGRAVPFYLPRCERFVRHML
ncbi:hypothetical protein [Rhizobium leucaenae]|uniref:Uncharacterized protein n=1 Tax=Rhizobium leucaenae TaxID=29450 RepID=A0A7W6ZYH6_9HYPH|nr:hypothetical protein [Rhizobium leucaenae]MBB4570552.1 hypothetical protein [Rhizobium leucaenae]MBB6303454.1 hypothetical protein [Rhizobium leucaenae]